MTNRAYKLAALFFLVFGLGCAIWAIGVARDSYSGIRIRDWYASAACLMALVTAGVIRFAASQKK